MMMMCKYKKWYNQIIEKYADVGNIFETHHIQPKSLGGSDDEKNLVRVSPRVHFILHQLLYRMTKGEDKRKMYYAVLLMGYSRQIRTGSHYQLLREKQGEIHSKKMKGITPWNKGKSGCFSEETINKMSKTRKGKSYGKAYMVEYQGVTYKTIKECSKATGLSHYMIKKYGNILKKYNLSATRTLS